MHHLGKGRRCERLHRQTAGFGLRFGEMDVVGFFAVSIVLVGFVGVILVVMVFLGYGLIAIVVMVVTRCGTMT